MWRSPGKIALWYSSILQSIFDGILVVDENAIVRFINPEYTRITGVRPEQIVGRPLIEVRPGAILPEVVRTGISRAGVFRREGNIEYVVDMAPIIIDKKIVGGVSVLKDITEVKRLSKELKRFVHTTNRLKAIVQAAFQARFNFRDIVGTSEGIRKAVSFAKKVAHGDNDILITGESGTGKEIFAQAIHNESGRASGPFVAFSCAALSSTLIESELFGYSEGAFTGARKGGKMGLFEVADGGTVFLDEIAEISLDMQVKLLRVLQERFIRRVGETEEIPVNIRIIAATNRDLKQLMNQGQFREDLFYRLNVVNINIPPLRQRIPDIKPLADYFLQRCGKRMNTSLGFHPGIYDVFARHTWPGNVRELINAVEYAVNMAESDTISEEHLPESVRSVKEVTAELTMEKILCELERRTIIERLNAHGRSVEAKKRIAQELGISLATLYSRINALRIENERG